MKTKYFLIILMVALFSASCQKEGVELFENSPDERLAQKIDEYYTLLQSASNGWIMTIEPKVGGAYRLWIKFKGNNRVEMLSDMDATWSTKEETSKVLSESSYRVRAMQTPALVFDTYNYIHLLADPQGTNSQYGNINGGVNGTGLASDFEFSLGEYENGRINLTGRYNKTVAYLDKATSAEESAILSGALKQTHTKLSQYFATIKYPVAEINGIKVDIAVGNRTTQFSYLLNDNLVVEKYNSYPDISALTENKSSSNIHFITPIKVNGVEISEIKFDSNGYFLAGASGQNQYLYDNKKPSIPLRFGYRQDFSQLLIDDSKLQGTLVDPFLTQNYLEARARLYTNGKRNMQYFTLAFKLHPTSGTPIVELVIRYNNSAGTNYNATWRYKYRVEENGNITFYEREQTGSSNERGQEPYLRAVVDYFCKLTYKSYSTANWAESVIDKIDPVTFKVDWGENNTPGSSASIGSLIPVSDPTRFVNGILSK